MSGGSAVREPQVEVVLAVITDRVTSEALLSLAALADATSEPASLRCLRFGYRLPRTQQEAGLSTPHCILD